MATPAHNILFPVETINRELDYRLFLAVMLAKPSRRIFIGNMFRINRMILSLRGGVYVGKHLFDKAGEPMRWYKPLKERGFSFVYLSEEGGIYHAGEDNWRRVLDRLFQPSWLRDEDLVCAWGDFQARHYIKNDPRLAANIRTTGHPRFDLYKPEYRAYYNDDADRLRKRFGRFVLINTNLALANNNRGLKTSFSTKFGYVPDNATDRMRAVRTWAHVNKILSGMVSLVHRLSQQFPDVTFVLRPHPSESIEFYQTVFRAVPNIHIEFSGPVGPWLLASEGLIHDGCTTAVEAYFLGRPIVNYKSIDNDDFDMRIPNELGVRCTTEEMVIEALGKVLDGHPLPGGQPSKNSRDLLHNFGHDAIKPCYEIIEEALRRSGPPTQSLGMGRIRLREAWAKLRALPRQTVRPFSKRYHYHVSDLQKFNGLDKHVLQKKITTIEQMLGKRVRFELLSDQLMVMEAGESGAD